MADQSIPSKKHLIAQQRAQQLSAKQHKGIQSRFTRARSQDGQPVAYRKVKENSVVNRQSRSVSEPEIPGSLVILNAKGLFQGRNRASVQNEGDITQRKLTVMEKDLPVFFDPLLNDKGESVSDLKKKFEVYKGEYEANKGRIDFLNPLHKLNNDKSVINKDTRYHEEVKKKLEGVISADALKTQSPVLKRNTGKILEESSDMPSSGLGLAGRRKLPVPPPQRPPPRVPQQQFRSKSDPLPFDEHSMSRICSTTGSNVVESVTEEGQCIEAASNLNCDNWNDDDEPIGDPDDFDDNDEWDSDFDSDDDDERNHDLQTSGNTSAYEVESLVFPDAASKKLYNIALEILTTERAYVRRLHLLDQVFYYRLNNECCAKGLLPVEALNEIFSNIQAIHQLHRDFLLPKLEARMKEWSINNKIGDILKELAPFLKLYAHYIGNFDKATETLCSWTKKSVATASVIEEIQKSKECESLSLQHHMLEPIQRVPRYKLLLKDYVSKLPEDSEDLKNTSDALEIISESASHANESMKKTERFKKLLEIQEKIGEQYHLITPSREFVSEGEFIKLSARTTETHQERTLMLFNDALLCCAKFPGTNKYKVKVTMDLYGMEVSSPDEDLEVANAFRIISKQRVMDFAATSSEAMEEWVKKLEEAINELTQKRDSYRRASKIELMNVDELGKKAPVWVRDEAVSMCMLCDVMFTAIRRRHHCRACGRVVCRSCSAFKASLEYDSGKQNRVCEICHKVLVKGASAESVKGNEDKVKNILKISPESKIWYSGYMNFKRKNDKIWQKRWFVLGADFVLYSHKAKKDTKAEFTLPLPGYSVDRPTLADEVDRKNVIKLHHKNTMVHFFETENEESMNRWKELFSRAVFAEEIKEEEVREISKSDK